MHVREEGLVPWRAADGPCSELGEWDHLWFKCLGNFLFRQCCTLDHKAQGKGHRVLVQEERKLQPQARWEQAGRQAQATGTCSGEISAS